MRVFAGLFFIASLCCAPASARDIHVDNVNGDDRFTGGQTRNTSDETGPVRTIARALQLALSGDAIVLAKSEEPYQESITLIGSRHSGLAGRPFILRGNGAVLDGSAPVPVNQWKNYQGAVFRFRPRHLGDQQLFLDNRPAVRVMAGALAEGLPKLEPKQWCSLRGEIYFCVEPTKLPADYHLSYADYPTGITLFHVEHVVIADLTVQGFQGDGICLYNTARHVSLVGVVCRGNGRSGVAVGGASVADIDASTLGNNGVAQLLTLPYSETHVRNSNLLSNTAPGWVDRGGRAYFGNQRLHGGLDEFHPAPEK